MVRIRTPVRWHPSRVGEARPNVGDPYADHERIEDDGLFPFQSVRLDMAEEDLRSVGEE